MDGYSTGLIDIISKIKRARNEIKISTLKILLIMVYCLGLSFCQLKKELIEDMIEPNAKIAANDDIAISSFVVKIIQAAYAIRMPNSAKMQPWTTLSYAVFFKLSKNLTQMGAMIIKGNK